MLPNKTSKAYQIASLQRGSDGACRTKSCGSCRAEDTCFEKKIKKTDPGARISHAWRRLKIWKAAADAERRSWRRRNFHALTRSLPFLRRLNFAGMRHRPAGCPLSRVLMRLCRQNQRGRPADLRRAKRIRSGSGSEHCAKERRTQATHTLSAFSASSGELAKNQAVQRTAAQFEAGLCRRLAPSDSIFSDRFDGRKRAALLWTPPAPPHSGALGRIRGNNVPRRADRPSSGGRRRSAEVRRAARASRFGLRPYGGAKAQRMAHFSQQRLRQAECGPQSEGPSSFACEKQSELCPSAAQRVKAGPPVWRENGASGF